jgi:hypothetical protein
VSRAYLFNQRVENAAELCDALYGAAKAMGCRVDELPFSGTVQLQDADSAAEAQLFILKRRA